MKTILILSSNINIQSILNFIIHKKYDVQLIKNFCSKEGVSELGIVLESFKVAIPDVVILDSGTFKNSLEKVVKEIGGISKEIPIVAVLDLKDQNNFQEISFFDRWLKIELYEDKIGKTLDKLLFNNPKGQEIETFNRPYLPIDLASLTLLNSLECDCYLKLNDNKMIKILGHDDLFGSEDYKKYQQKEINFFYIKRQEADSLINRLMDGLKTVEDLNLYTNPNTLASLRKDFTREEDQRIIDNICTELDNIERKKITYEESIKASTQVMNLVHSSVKKFGLEPQAQRLAKATAYLALSTIKLAPGLNSLFEKAQISDETYLNDHSILLSHVACQIAELIGWRSNMTFYKLTLAAMIHDVTLDNPLLAKYRGLPDLMIDADKFTDEELESYTSHPKRGAELIRQFPMIPPDIDIIVEQHHERPDGTGFPNQLNFQEISPLSTLFIVAHDLVTFILNMQKKTLSKEEWNVVSFLNQHRLLYQSGIFKDIFSVLWDNMINTSNTSKGRTTD